MQRFHTPRSLVRIQQELPNNMAIPLLKVRTKLGLDDTLGFGRHLGYTILEILKDRPEYISWLMQNTEIQFYDSVYNELMKRQAPVARAKPKHNPYGYMMPDYDTDTLGDWFDDVPF